MSSFDDYSKEMSGRNLTDSNIERLLRGDHSAVSDDDLRRFIASLSAREEPPRDVEQMATALAATARASSPDVGPRGFRRMVVLASAGVLVISLGGVAMASDTAAPGDVLYGMDRALERFGIGAGGVDERIAEFDEVMAHNQESEAYSLLAEVIEESDGPDLEKAQRHLELAATKTSPSAASAQQKVAELQEFIETYKGPDDPISGKAFGQGIAEIASSETDGEPDKPGTTPIRNDDQDPAEAGNSADQKGDNPAADRAEAPGNSGNAPEREKDVDPANPGNEPEHKDDAIPADPVQPPDQGEDVTPGRSEKAPQETPSKDSEEAPRGLDDAPGRQEDGPGNSDQAPGRQPEKPGQ